MASEPINDGPYRVVVHRSAAEMLAAARAALLRNEAANGLVLTIAGNLVENPQLHPGAFLATVADATGTVVGAAVRTPPFLGVATELPAAAELPAPKPFWVVFAVFFPAVTGIEAGIAMSGDLKDPARSLPRGTIGAVLVGYAVYMAIPLFLSYLIADTRILRHESMTMVMQHVARWG